MNQTQTLESKLYFSKYSSNGIKPIDGGLSEAQTPHDTTGRTCPCGQEVKKLCLIDGIRRGSQNCVQSR